MARDLSDVEAPLHRWLATHLGLDQRDLDVEIEAHTGGGYSNDILFVTARHADDVDRLVVRLPPAGPTLFPSYDLPMEVAVQDAVAAHGVPVPRPLVLETDATVLGTPFLLMGRVDGHDPGELPVADPWLAAAGVEQQRALHERFVDLLAEIHTCPWRDTSLADVLRGAEGNLLDEIRFWQDHVDWTFDGHPPTIVADAFVWCHQRRPHDEPPASVLWGDVRLGNVVFDDDFAPAAVLDWEMASIGPAELDVGWYTALEGMTEHFFGQRVPGFLTRDELVARHERAIGRPLVALEWFEIFAMLRSAVLNIRADRLEADRRGKPYRPVEANAVLTYALDAIATYDAAHPDKGFS